MLAVLGIVSGPKFTDESWELGRSLFGGGKITVPARSENGDAQEACAGEHAIEIKTFQNFLEILEVRWESQGRGRKRPRLFCVLLISGKMVLPYFFVQHSQEGGIFSVSRSGSRNRQCQDLGLLLQAVNIHGLLGAVSLRAPMAQTAGAPTTEV